MHSFARMEKKRRRTGAGQSRGDLWRRSVPDLPTPGHDDFALAAVASVRPLERNFIETVDYRQNPLRPPIRSTSAARLRTVCGFHSAQFPLIRSSISLTVLEQGFKILQREGIGPVAQRMVGVLMNFHEQRIDAGRDSRARQRRNILALAAGSVAQAAGQLQTMSRIENDGITQSRASPPRSAYRKPNYYSRMTRRAR